MNKKNTIISPQPAWAVYLRSSVTADALIIQARQRAKIQTVLLDPSPLPVFAEYSDLGTIRPPYWVNYQLMLADAQQGKFSHLALQDVTRLGRHESESFEAIQVLTQLGVQVYFADYPNLNTADLDLSTLDTLIFQQVQSKRRKQRG